MDIKEELNYLKADIDKEIEIYLNRVIKETESVDPFVLDALKYFKKMILSGGKRIRPIMMYWGYRAGGGTNFEEIVRTSVSIELIHAFLLMHDDIIDRDDLRRGKKTMHARYRDYNKRIFHGKDSEHFGNSIAIILGDFIYSLGNQVLFESNFQPQLIINALNKMQNVVGLTCVGEIQDVYMEYSDSVTKNDILAMYKNKTAKYTFEGPLQLGAMLAGADDELCDKLSDYAIPMGIAFQVRDDIIGVFGSIEKTGKPIDSDIAEGKKTLMVKKAFDNATKEQKKILKSLLGNQNINKQDTETFKEIIIKTGSLEYVENYIKELVEESCKSLGSFSGNMDNDTREFLFNLALYLQNREY